MSFTELSVCSTYNNGGSMRTTVPKFVVKTLKIMNKDKLVWKIKEMDDGSYSISVDVEHRPLLD